MKPSVTAGTESIGPPSCNVKSVWKLLEATVAVVRLLSETKPVCSGSPWYIHQPDGGGGSVAVGADDNFVVVDGSCIAASRRLAIAISVFLSISVPSGSSPS